VDNLEALMLWADDYEELNNDHAMFVKEHQFTAQVTFNPKGSKQKRFGDHRNGKWPAAEGRAAVGRCYLSNLIWKLIQEEQ